MGEIQTISVERTSATEYVKRKRKKKKPKRVSDIEIALDFVIKPRFVYANENVWQDCGRKAVEYGPLVLCAESCDNGKNLRAVRIRSLAGAKKTVGEYFVLEVNAERLRSGEALYSYEPPVSEKIALKLIPYFSWANRGKGDMQIWFL